MKVKRGRPSKEEARDTRKIILEKALELFSSKGYIGSSVGQLAQMVGVAKSAIYSHFKNKEEIFEQIFDLYGPPSMISIIKNSPLQRLEENPQEALLEILRQIIAVWEESRSYFGLVLVALKGEGPLGKLEKAKLLKSSVAQMKEIVRERIEFLQEKGIISNERSSDFLTIELLYPLGMIRILHFGPVSGSKDIAEGKSLIEEHIKYYLNQNLVHPKGGN